MATMDFTLRPPAYFGIIEYRTPQGNCAIFIVSKNSKQEGYQTVKPVERVTKERAAHLERVGNVVLSCSIMQSATTVTMDSTTSYPLKP
jgi:hypothetical protein